MTELTAAVKQDILFRFESAYEEGIKLYRASRENAGAAMWGRDIARNELIVDQLNKITVGKLTHTERQDIQKALEIYVSDSIEHFKEHTYPAHPKMTIFAEDYVEANNLLTHFNEVTQRLQPQTNPTPSQKGRAISQAWIGDPRP